MASKSDILVKLREILETADLNVVSGKQVRKQLAEELGHPMDEHKQMIKEEIDKYLREGFQDETGVNVVAQAGSQKEAAGDLNEAGPSGAGQKRKLTSNQGDQKDDDDDGGGDGDDDDRKKDEKDGKDGKQGGEGNDDDDGGSQPRQKIRKLGNRRKNDDDDDEGSAYPDPELLIELGNKKRVTVNTWKGEKKVNVRNFWEKDGKLFPTKKGVQLGLGDWEKLKDEVHAVTGAFESCNDGFEVGLGNRKTIRVKMFKGKPYVDIRSYYEKKGQLYPSQAGVMLNGENWQRFKNNFAKIDKALEDP